MFVLTPKARPVSGGAAPPPGPFAVLDTLIAAGKVVSCWIIPAVSPTSQFTLVGANVNAWAAYGGTNPVNLALETAAPQWDASLAGGKGGVTFNGTTQRFLGTAAPTGWPDADDIRCSLLAGVKQDATTSGARTCLAYGSGTANGTYRGLMRSFVSSTNRISASLGGTPANATSAVFTGAHTVGACGEFGTSAIYQDGVSQMAVAGPSAITPLTRIRLGANAASSAAGFWQGSICNAAVLGATADITDFTNLEAEFRARLT